MAALTFDDLTTAAPQSAAPSSQPSAAPSGQPSLTQLLSGGALTDTFGNGVNPSQLNSAYRGAQQGLSMNWIDQMHAAEAASPFRGGWLDPASYLGSIPLIGDAAKVSDLIPGALATAASKLAPSVFGTGAGATYDKALAQERANTQAAQKANPGSYATGELGGGLLGAMFLPEAKILDVPKTAPILSKIAGSMVNMGTTGAGYGAVAGAGANPDHPLTGALEGGALGAGMGAVGGPAMQGAGALIKGGARVFGAFDPEQMAIDLGAKRLARNGQDPTQLMQDVNAAQAAGAPNFTLADASDGGLEGLPGSITRQGGPAQMASQKFLQGRQYGNQGDIGARWRMNNAVGDLLGTQGVLGTADDLVEARSLAADPLYEAARQDPITMTQGLSALQQQLQKTGAWNYAQHMMDIDGKPFDLETLEPWDYMKRALDDGITAAKKNQQNNMARIFTGIKNKLVDELDQQSQNYQAARNVFSSHSDMLDALNLGTQITKPGYSTEQLARDMQGKTAGELQMMRIGASGELRDHLMDLAGTGKLPNAQRRDQALWQKLQALSPDQASYNLFNQRIANEGKMAKTEAVMGNSATAGRLAEDQHTAEDIQSVQHAVHAGAALATGNYQGFLGKVLPLVSRLSPSQRQSVMEEARKIYLNPDPDAIAGYVKRINAANMEPGIKTGIVNAIQGGSRGLLQPPSAVSIHPIAVPAGALAQQQEQQPKPAQPAPYFVQHDESGQRYVFDPNTGALRPASAAPESANAGQ